MRSRGIILVASTNAGFADVVGGMVLDSGFTPAYPRGVETPWVTVARTQPRLVICDCDAPVERIQRLVTDASARRVPLVLSRAPDACVDMKLLTLPSRFALLTFPVSQQAFCSMLDAMLPPTGHLPHPMTAIAANLTPMVLTSAWQAPPLPGTEVMQMGPERRRVSPRRSSGGSPASSSPP
ncbi:MAG: hypothetical protein ABJF01_12690 [bacterium]